MKTYKYSVKVKMNEDENDMKVCRYIISAGVPNCDTCLHGMSCVF